MKDWLEELPVLLLAIAYCIGLAVIGVMMLPFVAVECCWNAWRKR